MKIVSILSLLCLFLSCQDSKKENTDKNISINDYEQSQILGEPIIISIAEGNNLIYKIESDTLVDSDGDILLFGGVNVKVFENNLVTNNIYSNNAIVFNKSDSMSANGNVKIVSSRNGYILYTDTIMLYNQTKLVKADNEVLFINDEDSLKGIGFWSDFDMENWRIEKPIGSIIKGE